MKKGLKNIIIIILLILITIIIWFIFNSDNSKYVKKEYPIDGVSMNIKEGTLTNVGATIILKNDSDIQVSYGNPFSIEIKKDGEWKYMETDGSFTLPAFSLMPKTSKEIDINWKYVYGELSIGEYRLKKSFHYEKGKDNYVSFSVSVEFNIEG